MKIIFFAHSTTADNEASNATGWLQGELSEKGIKQAENLPRLINDNSFSIVFCSDLKRAIVSAELGFGSTHPIRHDWRLREANYGDFDGKHKSFKADMKMYIEQPYPNGESYKDVEDRIRSFVDDMKSMLDNEYVAVIGHEATQLALEVIIKNKTWEQAIDENWRPKQSWQPGWLYEF